MKGFFSLKGWTACLLGLVLLLPNGAFAAAAKEAAELAGTAHGTIYYVDSQKDYAELGAKTFLPGDKILFQRGKVFEGGVTLKGTGTADQWIEVGVYGKGNRPLLNGGGVEAVIAIKNGQYWKIGGLEMTNTSGTARNKNYSGIVVETDTPGTKSGYRLSDLVFHHVDGDHWGEPWTAGILFRSLGNDATTKFDNIVIENSEFYDQWSCGVVIHAQNSAVTHHTNVTLKNLSFRNLGGMGWLFYGVDNSLVDHVATYDIGRPGKFDYGVIVAGFPRDARNITVQNSESARIVPSNDSHAWDADINMGGTNIWQYNYSHDNPGGIFLSLGNNDSDFRLIYRYNISENDGNAYFDLRRDMPAEIYNNTIYSERTPRIGPDYASHSYYNNIWYSTSGGTRNFPAKPNFDNNSYYGFTANVKDAHKVTADPKLSAPGTGGDGIGSAKGYKLQPNSPLINAGRKIVSNGGRDYWGNPLSDGKPDIGAHEFANDAPAKGSKPVRTKVYRYEAEDGNLAGGPVVSTNRFASGLGIVGSMHFTDASLELTGIYVEKDGPRRVELNYATNDPAASMKIVVNGDYIGEVSLPSTGGWGAAKGKAAVTAYFRKGIENKIRIVHGKSGADFDYVELSQTVENMRGAAIKADGWLEHPDALKNGNPSSKLHLNLDLEGSESSSPEGKLKLRDDHSGLRLDAKDAEWMLASPSGDWIVQAEAKDKQDKRYKVQIRVTPPAMPAKNDSSLLSVTVWEGDRAEGEPLLQTKPQSLHGRLAVRRKLP